MSNGASRREAWREESDASKLRLVINELDEFGGNFRSVDDRIEKMAKSMNRRLNWMLGIFIGLLVGVLGNLVVLVVTR